MTEAFTDQDGFTDHYLRELESLRREGRDFADRYPKVAARLKLEDADSPDPHVERLLEAFAFLSARVQRKLDDDFPELSDALLEVLYPHLVRPIPSMALVELELDFEQSIPTAGLTVERGTAFLSKPVRGEPLRFRSTSSITLWPIQVAEAAVEPVGAEVLGRYPDARSVLRLRLKAVGEHPFGKLELEHLTFFLKGEAAAVAQVYELLSASVAGISISTGERGNGFALPLTALRPLGFDEDQTMLPYPRRAFSGYRLLQEYFAFPAKFQFLELGGLEALRDSPARQIDIRFVLRREPAVSHAEISADTFSLTCVPLINLFEANADPILLSPYVSEHDVVADAQRPLDLEIYAVEEVTGLKGGGGSRTAYDPFYSIHHDTPPGAARTYWHTIRRASRKKGDEGTEVAVALVDLDLQRVHPEDDTLHVRVLCSNRDVPFVSGTWGRPDDFGAEGVTGLKSIRCVHRPTRTLRPGLGGAVHWRLLSQLSLNYLSIVREGRSALREILRVYDFAGTPASREQVEGIVEVRSEPAVRWLRSSFGGGFARGTHTTLVLDRDRYVGANPFLLAAVVERFLALYCAINSFSELSLETPQDQGEVYRWSPRAGERILL